MLPVQHQTANKVSDKLVNTVKHLAPKSPNIFCKKKGGHKHKLQMNVNMSVGSVKSQLFASMASGGAPGASSKTPKPAMGQWRTMTLLLDLV